MVNGRQRGNTSQKQVSMKQSTLLGSQRLASSILTGSNQKEERSLAKICFIFGRITVIVTTRLGEREIEGSIHTQVWPPTSRKC